MHTAIKNIHFILFFMLCSLSMAQEHEVEIFGTIVEEETAQAVPYATVVVYKNGSKEIVSGATSDDNGNFSLYTKASDFYVEISFMGYKTKVLNNLSAVNNKINLGVISLSQDNLALEEVVVTGEVSKTVFKLDKRVFNVGSDISSTGASALEVLGNVPSVNVSIEGEISLRGSTGVQILINGKPSVLADESSNALGTLTADMIESIEVITNPSAKYEASGTAGILNIILKKEEKEGWNGSISANTGTPDNHSMGISLNRRTEKFNLFTQMGVGYRSLPRDNKAINTNLISNEEIFSNGTAYRDEMFYNITLGTDYHINERNVLTLSGNFAYEIEDQPSETNFKFFDSNNTLVSSWLRNETTEATNPKYQYEFNYKKEFKNSKEHTLQLSALGSFFGKEQSSQFTNSTLSEKIQTATNKPKPNSNKQNTLLKPIIPTLLLQNIP